MKNPFNDRQSKVMKQLGLKDTKKVAQLSRTMLKNCCEDCRILLQTTKGEPICKECLEKNREVIKDMLKIKKKMRGY